MTSIEDNRAYQKAWREKNPNKQREYRTRFYEKHPEKIIEKREKERVRNANNVEANRVRGQQHYAKCNENIFHYLRYVLKSARRRKTKFEWLTLDDLKNIWNLQEGKCALTGVAMTHCVGLSRMIPTNASIDRIDNSKTYTANNIRLVCAIVNVMRREQTLNDFIKWCRLVASMGQTDDHLQGY